MPGHFLDELRDNFDAQSTRPAIAYRGRTISYGELDAWARRCAARLQRLSVEPGDRVALFTPNKLPFLVAHLGAMYAGAAPLPLNPSYTREELRYFFSDSQARLIVAGAEQRALAESVAASLDRPPHVVPDQFVFDVSDASPHEVRAGADDPCLVVYSSGTTGWPKGVVHTHQNAASALRALQDAWRMTADDVVVNVLPLFHVHGLCFATHLTWLAGGCVHVEDTFEPRASMEAIACATVFMSVPTLYYRLLEDPEFPAIAQRWTRARLFTCGSAPIRPEVLPRLQEILRRPVINRYGMTEAYVITSLPLDGPWPDGSVGLPLAGVELRLVGGDGAPAAPREAGSVQIRGPNLFRQYWQNLQATREAMASGWFDTGDVGTLDANGFLTLQGRKHDLIITNGFNVYPQVVERVINDCPGVRECAVVGLPDARRGERVAAAIVRHDPALDEATLVAWWNDRLVYYQQPKQVVFVEGLPRNALGKVLRRELREQLRQAAGDR